MKIKVNERSGTVDLAASRIFRVFYFAPPEKMAAGVANLEAGRRLSRPSTLLFGSRSRSRSSLQLFVLCPRFRVIRSAARSALPSPSQTKCLFHLHFFESLSGSTVRHRAALLFPATFELAGFIAVRPLRRGGKEKIACRRRSAFKNEAEFRKRRPRCCSPRVQFDWQTARSAQSGARPAQGPRR